MTEGERLRDERALREQILEKANRLIERYGDEAIAKAREEASSAPVGAFPSDKDIAMRVLTKVEELLNFQTS